VRELWASPRGVRVLEGRPAARPVIPPGSLSQSRALPRARLLAQVKKESVRGGCVWGATHFTLSPMSLAKRRRL